MRSITALSLLALAACGTTETEPEDRLSVGMDEPALTQDETVTIHVADRVPEGHTLAAPAVSGSVGDHASGTYFVTADNRGRLKAHHLHGEDVHTVRISGDTVESVQSVSIEESNGKGELVVHGTIKNEDGTSFEQDFAMTSDGMSLKTSPRERRGPARTWRSQDLDEVLAMSITCAARGHDPNADIDSQPTRHIKGAILTAGPGAAWTVQLPEVGGDHAAPQSTVQVDPAAGLCNGVPSHHQITTVTNHFPASSVLSDAFDCASDVAEGTAYGSAAPTLKYDEENQWLAMFDGDDGLTVKLEYDGSEMSECTRMDG